MFRAVLAVKFDGRPVLTSKPAAFFERWSTKIPLTFRIVSGMETLVRHNYHEFLTWTLAVQVNTRTERSIAVYSSMIQYAYYDYEHGAARLRHPGHHHREIRRTYG